MSDYCYCYGILEATYTEYDCATMEMEQIPWRDLLHGSTVMMPIFSPHKQLLQTQIPS